MIMLLKIALNFQEISVPHKKAVKEIGLLLLIMLINYAALVLVKNSLLQALVQENGLL